MSLKDFAEQIENGTDEEQHAILKTLGARRWFSVERSLEECQELVPIVLKFSDINLARFMSAVMAHDTRVNATDRNTNTINFLFDPKNPQYGNDIHTRYAKVIIGFVTSGDEKAHQKFATECKEDFGY